MAHITMLWSLLVVGRWLSVMVVHITAMFSYHLKARRDCRMNAELESSAPMGIHSGQAPVFMGTCSSLMAKLRQLQNAARPFGATQQAE